MQILRLTLSFSGVFFCLISAGCEKKAPVQAKKQTEAVDVRVVQVGARDITRVVESVGTMYPFDETVVSAEIDGRVEKVEVDLGDTVTAGQVLVRIGDEEQRYIMAQNEAQLLQSMERLGLRDEKDKLKDAKDAPEARKAFAELYEAEQRAKRQKQLAEQGVGAQADSDQAQARLRAAQANYDATLYQARNLAQEVERFKAQLELQRKKLRDTLVRAPFAGAVKERAVNAGQYVRTNTPLFTLVKTNPLRLKLEIPERMAPWVRIGQLAQVEVEAFEGKKFSGKVWRISPTVDQAKRTFVTEVLIDNSSNTLKPGSYARAHLPTDKVERVTVVPASSVAYVFGANKVYVVKDNTVETRDVKLGDRFENTIEILEGVTLGDTVAVTGLARLDTGSKVKIVSGIEAAAADKGI
jgi:multidrug efflux pump subunit AcrA (membrane-fusion protein)